MRIRAVLSLLTRTPNATLSVSLILPGKGLRMCSQLIIVVVVVVVAMIMIVIKTSNSSNSSNDDSNSNSFKIESRLLFILGSRTRGLSTQG